MSVGIIIPSRYTSRKPPIGAQVDHGNALAKGLVGCWLMNEGKGKRVKNLISSKSDGYFSGQVSFNDKKEVYFNNAALSYIQCYNYDNKLKVQEHTAIVRLRFDYNDNEVILSRESITSSGYEWYIGANVNGVIGYAYYDTAIRGWYEMGAALSTGSYYTLGLMWNKIAGLASAYKNGAFYASVATTTGTITHSSSVNFKIGGRDYNSDIFQGVMDYLYLYERVLTPAEIKSLYVAPYQFIQPVTRKFYSLPEEGGAVTVTPDAIALTLSPLSDSIEVLINQATVTLAASVLTQVEQLDMAPGAVSITITAAQAIESIAAQAAETTINMSALSQVVQLITTPQAIALALSILEALPGLPVTVYPDLIAMALNVQQATPVITIGRTYFTYDPVGRYISFVVEGNEVMRIKANKDVDVSGNVNQGAF